MAGESFFFLDPGWLREFIHDPAARELLMEVGQEVADYARDLAPKRTGAGAASIHPEWDDDRVLVSWDREHYYMKFSELPTKHMPLHPFLQPALDRYRIT